MKTTICRIKAWKWREMHSGWSCIDIAKCDIKALSIIRQAKKIHNDNFVHWVIWRSVERHCASLEKIACRNDEMIIMIVMHTETKLMNLYGLSFGISFYSLHVRKSTARINFHIE